MLKLKLREEIQFFITNKVTEKRDFETFRRIIFLSIVALLGILFLTLLAILALLQKNYKLFISDFSMVLVFIVIFIALKRVEEIRGISFIGLLVLSIFYLWLFLTGGENQTAFVWYYTFPIISVFLVGNKWALLFNAILILLTFASIFFAPQIEWMTVYNRDFLLRFFPSYIAVFLFTSIMERTRIIIHRRIENLNNEQQILISQLEEAKEELKNLSIKDGLTGLFNRRYFDEILPLICAQKYRYNDIFSLLMIDVDFFKKYNDRYGHLIGDKALQDFSKILSDSLRRETDMAFRYGGEEFIIILTSTNRETTIDVAKNIIEILERENIEHKDSASGFLSCSIGIVLQYSTEKTKIRDLVKIADDALYEAKGNGRDCYILKENR